MNLRWKAFTLIELAFVIVIVAILAVIAVVRLTEAQTRSKVTRAKADINGFFVGLEAYAVDHKAYPYPRTEDDRGKGFLNKVFELTTPTAYLSSVDVLDPFKPVWRDFVPGRVRVGPGSPEPVGWKAGYQYYNYSLHGFVGQQTLRHPDQQNWSNFDGCCIASVGPDRVEDGLYFLPLDLTVGKGLLMDKIYDPSNGTNSWGGVGRCNGPLAYFNAF